MRLMKPLSILAVLAVSGFAAMEARAATVVLRLVPDILELTDDTDGAVLAAPGGDILYFLRVEVQSEVPAAPDNAGLAMVQVDIETDLGVAQDPVMEPPFLAAIFTAFTNDMERGEPGDPDDDDFDNDDDILGVRLGNEAGEAEMMFAVDEEMVLASGMLNMPDVEGDFTVMIGEAPMVKIFNLAGIVVDPDVVQRVGFVVRTVEGTEDSPNDPMDDDDSGVSDDDMTDTDGDDGDGDDGTTDDDMDDTTDDDDMMDDDDAGDGTDQDDDTTDETDTGNDTSHSPNVALATALVGVGALLAVTVGVWVLFGPMFAVAALIAGLLAALLFVQ